MKRIKVYLLLLFCLCMHFSSHAQSWDTTKYLRYENRLVVGLFQSWRSYNVLFSAKNDMDTLQEFNYGAEANNVTGIEMHYDKVSFSLGFRTTPPTDASRKGQTSYKNFSFSFGGNRWLLETSYRRYKGFYDLNSANYDTSFINGGPYYQNTSLKSEVLRGKFLFFFNNKKFSYRAAYSSTYRQIKSAATLLAVGNIYYNELSSDTSFIPSGLRNDFSAMSNTNSINNFGVSAGGGVSTNIVVFKRVFVNVTLTIGLESQWRKYGTVDGRTNAANYISASGDARVAIGYNGKNFFITVNSMNDWTFFSSKMTNITSKYISGSFTIGYRFKLKEYKWIKAVKENKFYKML